MVRALATDSFAATLTSSSSSLLSSCSCFSPSISLMMLVSICRVRGTWARLSGCPLPWRASWWTRLCGQVRAYIDYAVFHPNFSDGFPSPVTARPYFLLPPYLFLPPHSLYELYGQRRRNCTDTRTTSLVLRRVAPASGSCRRARRRTPPARCCSPGACRPSPASAGSPPTRARSWRCGSRPMIGKNRRVCFLYSFE